MHAHVCYALYSFVMSVERTESLASRRSDGSDICCYSHQLQRLDIAGCELDCATLCCALHRLCELASLRGSSVDKQRAGGPRFPTPWLTTLFQSLTSLPLPEPFSVTEITENRPGDSSPIFKNGRQCTLTNCNAIIYFETP